MGHYTKFDSYEVRGNITSIKIYSYSTNDHVETPDKETVISSKIIGWKD